MLFKGLNEDNKWPYILAGSILTLIVIAQCAFKLTAWVKDSGYIKQKKRLEQLTVLKNARKDNPEISLDAEINAVAKKLNDYDAWQQWQQKKTETVNVSLSKKKRQKNFSECFAWIYSFFLLVLWGVFPLLKVTGLFTPEKGSMLSRFTIKDTVFLLFCSMPVVWLLTYAFAYYFYSQIKKSDDPISRWFFSWISISLPFSAMIAVSVENSPERTGKFLLVELALNIIVLLFVILGLTMGRGCNYLISRWVFSTRLSEDEQYHAPLSTRSINFGFAGSNVLFWAALSVSFELAYSSVIDDTVIDNIVVMGSYCVLSLIVFLAGPVAFLGYVYCIVLGIDFAFHGRKVTFHIDKKCREKEQVVAVDEDWRSVGNPKKEQYLFKGWMQKDSRDIVELEKVLPPGKCGEINLYCQWKKVSH